MPNSLLLTDTFVNSYKDKTVPWGYGGLGYLVYKRTYSRTKENGKQEEWYETVARCINGAQKIGAQYTKEEMERLYDHVFHLRCNFAGRMLWQLGTNIVERYAANALLNCLAPETRVLTRDGWKSIITLAGQEIEICSSHGQWIKAPIRSFGVQELTAITFANRCGTKKWTIYATPGHQWLVKVGRDADRTRVSTCDLRIGDRVPLVRPKCSSQYLSPQGIQHGLVFGDGSCDGYESFIDLIDNTYDECKHWFNHNRISWTNSENPRHVRYGGMPNYYKQLPSIRENKPYLLGFLAGWLAADGSVNKSSGTIRLFSASREQMVFARDVSAICGLRTSEPYLERDVNPFNGEDSELWSISFYLSDNPELLIIRGDHRSKLKAPSEIYDNLAKVIKIEKTDRVEEVFCATVPDTGCFVIDGHILTGNCWMTTICKPDDFCFLFENLMMGGGVGYSVRREDVHELPKVKKGVEIIHLNTKDADFIVPDSRGGWVSLLRKVLDSWFVTGNSFSYSTILVRSAGEVIKGFGGTASGPVILVEGLAKICKVLAGREGKKLRSIDALDICNIIGSIVVAGNIRRSAEIGLGDPDDILFLRAKRWDLGNIPHERSMSNNTIYADEYSHIMNEVWEGYNGNGEPYGFFNLPLSQSHGRLKDGKLKKEDNAVGTNPCITGDTILIVERQGGKFPLNVDSYAIGDLVGNTVKIYNGRQWSEVDIQRTGIKQPILTVRVKTNCLIGGSSIQELRCTPYHKWYDKDHNQLETKDLTPGLELEWWITPIGSCIVSQEVVEVLDKGEREDVFCFNEPLQHRAVFNGILTGQCGEISLANKECCDLAELYLNNIESSKQLIDCAKLLYKTQKAILALPFLHEETNKIVHKNMRLGLGVTGICQSLHKLEWLDECYEELKQFDKEWSKKRDWPESIKLTTTKPSGSLSLLAGATPGIHPGFASFYIRRVRMSSTDKLVPFCRDQGYHVEYEKNQDGTEKHDTIVVEFPCESGKDAIIAKDMPAIRQLELVKQIQTIWSDNAVSVTVYYQKEELPAIKEWLKHNYKESIKSVSFLLHSAHGFVQAPYQEITEEQYREMVGKIKKVKPVDDLTGGGLDVEGCVGGACPIK